MKRYRILLLVVFIVFVQTVVAQDYITQGATPNLHLVHKVSAKETWYSIGRAYNLSSKEIASYNKLKVDKPLEIGQSVNIPLTAANFSQNGAKGAGEVLVPVYHIVQEKEWMYRISVNHNKVPIEKLEKWNSIKRDEAKAGMKLIVGYLKVKEANASLAAKSSEEKTAVKKTDEEEKAIVKTDVPKKTVEEKKTSDPVATTSKQVNNSKDGGYFKGQYEEVGKKSSGVTGIFKSTSGWNDGKYYALMNNVTVGTIIKIVFSQTNKAVYAKVLGELPDMKESAGLALRISDAAASELGASNTKFSVDVRY